MTEGSQQLRRYLRFRRGGASMEDAAELAVISIGEAKLIDADEAKGNLAHIDTAELIGHNSGDKDMADETEDKGSIAAQELRLFIERVERLEEEKKGIADDIKDVMSEMKGRGYDTKIVRKLISIRKKKKGEHDEEQMVLETYMAALGMI
jgi:uncharacterized protein (UPF0335 family)